MSDSRRQVHLECFKSKINHLALAATGFLSRFSEGKRLDSLDYRFLQSEMAYIRGAAVRLRLSEVVQIGKLGEEVCFKIASAPNDASAQRLLLSLKEALGAILNAIENPSPEPPVELVMMRFRFESLLENLSN
jgi:hypothetical protein